MIEYRKGKPVVQRGRSRRGGIVKKSAVLLLQVIGIGSLFYLLCVICSSLERCL